LAIFLLKFGLKHKSLAKLAKRKRGNLAFGAYKIICPRLFGSARDSEMKCNVTRYSVSGLRLAARLLYIYTRIVPVARCRHGAAGASRLQWTAAGASRLQWTAADPSEQPVPVTNHV